MLKKLLTFAALCTIILVSSLSASAATVRFSTSQYAGIYVSYFDSKFIYLNADEDNTVSAGTELEIDVYLNKTYDSTHKVKSVTANGIDIPYSSYAYFYTVKDDDDVVDIVVTIEDITSKKYTVSVATVDGGSISVYDYGKTFTINSGNSGQVQQDTKIYITPSVNSLAYAVGNVSINGVDYPYDQYKATWFGWPTIEYTVTGDIEVSCAFNRDATKAIMSLSDSENGSFVVKNGETTLTNNAIVSVDDKLQIIPTANDEYQVKTVIATTANGTDIINKDDDGNYYYTVTSEDFTVAVNFTEKPKPRDIYVSVAKGQEAYGKVEVVGSTNNIYIEAAGEVVLKATPTADNVSFVGWTDANGNFVSRNATFTYYDNADGDFVAHFGYQVNLLKVTSGTVTISCKKNDNFSTNNWLSVTKEDPVDATAASEDGTPIAASDDETTSSQATTIDDIQITNLGSEIFEADKEIYVNIDAAAYGSESNHIAYVYVRDEVEKTNTTYVFANADTTADTQVQQTYVPITLDKPYNVGVTFWSLYTGVNNISVDATNATPEYYNLNGARVDKANLTPGLYIVRTGNTVTKQIIK